MILGVLLTGDWKVNAVKPFLKRTQGRFQHAEYSY